MQRALELAQQGLYTADPNPRVGCVIVKDGGVVGEGAHLRAGEPHAEIHALNKAGERAAGATAYLTLEPCAHHGRTPPCCEALSAASVSRVVIAMQDPNPLVAGKGTEFLRAQGVQVDVGLLENEARQLNRGFISRMHNRRPFVRLKMASSLDGRSALANGQSQWITGKAAREDGYYWRARASAILTGAGTVIADDPSLNLRLTAEQLSIQSEPRQPFRVVLDPGLITSPDAAIYTLPGKACVVTAVKQLKEFNASNVQVIQVAGDENSLDLSAVLSKLAELEINELHVEAGAVLSGAFMQQGLVDELLMYIAPSILGSDARGLFDLPELTDLSQRHDFVINDVSMIGDDLRIVAGVK